MTLEEMKARKIELGLTNEMVAEASGIPLSTVQKIFSGLTKAPRKSTIDALTAALSVRQDDHPGEAGGGSDLVRRDAAGEDPPVYTSSGYDPAIYGGIGSGTGRHTSSGYDASRYGASGYGTFSGKRDRGILDSNGRDDNERRMVLREPEPAYRVNPGGPRYTIDDYYALPDDQRVELIDGVFYDMGAPALIHQRILGDLHILFRECADRHDMPCEVYLSPCDVRLDMDNYTMVQPDLLVICGDYDIRAIRYEGAPDLVVEILSPSTRSKDLLLKLHKYHNAGVREYWIIDPMYRTVTVHFFEEEDYHPRIYEFNSEISIGISGGQCVIDFSRIMERIKRYYE